MAAAKGMPSIKTVPTVGDAVAENIPTLEFNRLAIMVPAKTAEIIANGTIPDGGKTMKPSMRITNATTATIRSIGRPARCVRSSNS